MHEVQHAILCAAGAGSVSAHRPAPDCKAVVAEHVFKVALKRGVFLVKKY